MRPSDISRRDFLRSAATMGIFAAVIPLDQALADLQIGTVPNHQTGYRTAVRFRRDGISAKGSR